MNVLLVDESSLYHSILEMGLAELGATLDSVATGIEALQMAGMLQYDIVAVSLQLSDMDGMALTRRLRELPSFEHVPVVILTGSASQELSHQAGLSGVTEVFRKQDIGELVNFMRRLLVRYQPMQGSVLYVEDTASQRLAMTALLHDWGLQVDAYPNADAAWQPFATGDYDLVITDIVVDGHMSGSRFINRIRRQDGSKGDVPILAVTAFDNMARRAELFHLGVNDYIPKPILPEELHARIQSLISTKRLIDRNEMGT